MKLQVRSLAVLPPVLSIALHAAVIGFGGAVRFTLASNPGAVHGTVKSSDQAVAGAPVFLEPSDIEPARRLSETLVTRTDIQGQYRFTGLAPGNYRLLASFEYSSADSTTMSIARAAPIIIEAAGDSHQDLDLYVE
jgi:Carboxypeptidase regulatory-like domain